MSQDGTPLNGAPEPRPPSVDPADLARLRDAQAELDERIRQQRLAERNGHTPERSTPPTPGPTLGQQVQVLRDELTALRLRMDRAAEVVKELIREFRAAGHKADVKKKPQTKGAK